VQPRRPAARPQRRPAAELHHEMPAGSGETLSLPLRRRA
jgi:hypothetical protein